MIWRHVPESDHINCHKVKFKKENNYDIDNKTACSEPVFLLRNISKHSMFHYIYNTNNTRTFLKHECKLLKHLHRIKVMAIIVSHHQHFHKPKPLSLFCFSISCSVSIRFKWLFVYLDDLTLVVHFK